jgi:hypothetical protein
MPPTSTSSSPSSALSSSTSARPRAGLAHPAPRAPRRKRSRPRHTQRQLGCYADRDGHQRELVALAGAAGSTLVVDRYRATHGDARLLAHLAADEPSENAALVCRRYLEDLDTLSTRCRLLSADDTQAAPFTDDDMQAAAQAEHCPADARLSDRHGCSYSLERLPTGMAIPELRWCRAIPDASTELAPVSLREAVAALEAYEPLCALTLHALVLHRHDGALSTTVLRTELARLRQSPIVLNRPLREKVLAVVAQDELSMSEIALRCGRVKRDRKGNESGETSWLARRLGLLAEGGHSTTTPWIHTDVLALIARRGLGISPREVEP